MNRKLITLFFLLILLFNNLFAQKTYLGFDTGYGTYAMNSIKNVLESSVSNNVLQPQRVSNFPGYVYFRPYIEIEYKYLNCGFSYSLMSTGARYSIHDYSGEYKLDSKIAGNAFGVYIELPLFSIKRFRFLIATEAGVSMNILKLDESMIITDAYHQQDNYKFRSFNYFVKPYLKLEYKIGKNLKANYVLGYYKEIVKKNMQLLGNNPGETNIVADWSGLRTSIGICYCFE